MASSNPMTVPVTCSFNVSALRDGDEITKGKAVSFEMGTDPKSGKPKAVSVDLA